MTYAQMRSQIRRMSQAEKISLMKALAESLTENAVEKRKHTLKHLYGVLRPKTGKIPTNRQIRKEYQNYLIEKYK